MTYDGYDPDRCVVLANRIERAVCGERPVNVLTAIAMIMAGYRKDKPVEILKADFDVLKKTSINYHKRCGFGGMAHGHA